MHGQQDLGAGHRSELVEGARGRPVFNEADVEDDHGTNCPRPTINNQTENIVHAHDNEGVDSQRPGNIDDGDDVPSQPTVMNGEGTFKNIAPQSTRGNPMIVTFDDLRDTTILEEFTNPTPVPTGGGCSNKHGGGGGGAENRSV